MIKRAQILLAVSVFLGGFLSILAAFCFSHDLLPLWVALTAPLLWFTSFLAAVDNYVRITEKRGQR